MLREIARQLLPDGVVETPKRPVQTPQREWLRGPLQSWADNHIREALDDFGGTWLDVDEVEVSWKKYCNGAGDNSFYVWQWINLNLMARNIRASHESVPENCETATYEASFQSA